jgi:transposase InsO family protein
VNVYPFIEAEKAQQHNVKRACQLLEVSRSAYYAHRAGPSARERQDVELTEAIVEVHEASGGTYGAPRVQAELRDQGRRHSRKRIARLMRQAGRRGRTPKRWRTTTIPDPAASARPDLIRRDFRTAPGQVNARWCADITYINTWDGWLYLATVIDLASRRVVGWATADHLRTDLVAEALTNAVAARRPTDLVPGGGAGRGWADAGVSRVHGPMRRAPAPAWFSGGQVGWPASTAAGSGSG